MKKEQLITVAKELNELLGLDPPLDVKQKDLSKLEKQVIDAALILEIEDKVSEETVDALVPLFAEGTELGKALTDEQAEVFTELGILPPPDEDVKDDDDTPPDEDDDLQKEVEDAERLRDLKDIAKANDEFKGIRGKLSKYKTTKDLREEMLEILEDNGGENDPEEKETPSARKKSGEATKKSAKKESAEKKEPVDTYSRVDSVCDVLKGGKVKTMDDLYEKANDLYNERKGKDNIKESRTVANFIVKALAQFDIEVPSK